MRIRAKGFLALSAILFLISILWLGLIGAMGYFELEREEISRTFVLEPGANLTVKNMHGKTEVDLYDGETIEVKFIKKTRFGNDQLDDVKLMVDEDGDLDLEVKKDIFKDWVETDLEIRIPEFINLTFVENVAGHITIDGTSGELTAITDSGGIEIKNVKYIKKAEADSGGIIITNADYVVKASTSSGGVAVKDTRYVEVLSAENGGVSTENVDILEEATADNGGLHILVNNLSQEGMFLSVNNGGIYIEIPADLDADFDMRVENGAVELADFDSRAYDIDEEEIKKGYVNGGGPLIKMRADNGGIQLVGV